MKSIYTHRLSLMMILFLILGFTASAQEDTLSKQNIKTGWTFGLLPAISFNTDLGFQYGGLINLYHFGDGSTYPRYRHSLYAEWSKYTKGSGINRLFYDSEYLIPGVRVTADLCYLPDMALDFYGFNGYQAIYNPDFENDTHPDYKSRMFYRHQRNTFRFIGDLRSPIRGSNFKWVAGVGVMHNQVAPVDLERLNEGKATADLLPEIPGLYEKYIEWGIIDQKEKDGGWSNNIKLGLIYDTRDFEPNPMQGVWSEIVLFAAPEFLGNCNLGYAKLSATHRQYFTLIPEKLSFVYRIGGQATVAGKTPFFMQPYMISSYNPSATSDGLGGAKNLRGILRNRVVGDAIAYGNAEFRWKFFRAVILNQNLYLALNLFTDAGQVIKPIEVNLDEVPEGERALYFNPGKDMLHTSAGIGLRIVLNENFIVAADFGRAFDRRDGTSGLYIGLNYLF
jgi:outer membrane protein assembly factor BamA